MDTHDVHLVYTKRLIDTGTVTALLLVSLSFNRIYSTSFLVVSYLFDRVSTEFSTVISGVHTSFHGKPMYPSCHK